MIGPIGWRALDDLRGFSRFSWISIYRAESPNLFQVDRPTASANFCTNYVCILCLIEEKE